MPRACMRFWVALTLWAASLRLAIASSRTESLVTLGSVLGGGCHPSTEEAGLGIFGAPVLLVAPAADSWLGSSRIHLEFIRNSPEIHYRASRYECGPVPTLTHVADCLSQLSHVLGTGPSELVA